MVNVIPYPFVRCKVEVFDGEAPRMIESWRPGIEDWMPNAYCEGKYADGMGSMTLTEVSRHKPGKYPERVFYTRKFTTPDGVLFGKGGLRMTTATRFARLCKGYAHPFVIDAKENP